MAGPPGCPRTIWGATPLFSGTSIAPRPRRLSKGSSMAPCRARPSSGGRQWHGGRTLPSPRVLCPSSHCLLGVATLFPSRPADSVAEYARLEATLTRGFPPLPAEAAGFRRPPPPPTCTRQRRKPYLRRFPCAGVGCSLIVPMICFSERRLSSLAPSSGPAPH